VLGRPSDREAPEPEWLVARLSQSLATFPVPPLDQDRLAPALAAAVAEVVATGAAPMSVPGVIALLSHADLAVRLDGAVEQFRGRDSAGLHLMITGHGLDVGALAGEPRLHDLLFTSKAVRAPFGHLSFVYKAAAEIGELGDNTRAMREAIRRDDLLHRSLEAETARCTVLGHTRWASVGIISEANAQ